MPKPNERVREARARLGTVLVLDDVRLRLDGAPLTASRRSSRSIPARAPAEPGAYLDGREPFGARSPEDTVFNLIPFGVSDDVRDTEAGKKSDDSEGKDRAAPRPPACFGRLEPVAVNWPDGTPKYMKTETFFACGGAWISGAIRLKSNKLDGGSGWSRTSASSRRRPAWAAGRRAARRRPTSRPPLRGKCS